MKFTLLATTIAVALGTAQSAQAINITPAVEYTSNSPLSDSRPFTLGYSFSLSATTTINALGYWDNGRPNSHQVGIWTSSGTLIGSTTVLGTDQLTGHFRWNAFNLTLAAGNYVIGGEFLGDGTFNSGATGLTTIANYTYGTDLQSIGGFGFPTTSSGGGYGGNGILEANFSVGGAVPEPAAWALMVGGFGLVGFAARRRAVALAA